MYERFFNSDNAFWRGMGRVFDAVELNILWLVCCIPIVTIGPSTAAFYSAMITLIRGEESYVYRDFFLAFRHKFRRNMGAGLLITALGVFLALDVYICRKSGLGIYTFMMVFFAVMFVIWAFVALYSFPLLGKLDGRLRDIFLLAFTMSIKHLSQTLMMLFVTVLAVWLCHLMPGLIFVAFGVVCEFQSTMFAVMLKPWLPKLEHAEDDDLDREAEDAAGEEVWEEEP